MRAEVHQAIEKIRDCIKVETEPLAENERQAIFDAIKEEMELNLDPSLDEDDDDDDFGDDGDFDETV